MSSTYCDQTVRVSLDDDFVTDLNAGRPLHQRGQWPARWVSIDPLPAAPFIAAYRCAFTLEQAVSFRLHLTADERYELYLDGRLIGRGPERGDVLNWYYQSYRLSLEAGRHMLVAIVQRLGDYAPLAQVSVRHGLLVAAELPDPATLDTGSAPWQARPLTGLQFTTSPVTFGVGSYVRMIGREMSWGIERGEGENWTAVTTGPIGLAAHDWRNWDFAIPMLRPSVLPEMRETDRHIGRVRHIDDIAGDTRDRPVLPVHDKRHEHDEWNALLTGNGSLNVPAHTQRRIIIDLDDYYCAYPMMQVSGGAGSVLSLQWAESLYAEPTAPHAPSTKGNRDEIENKRFVGVGDVFEPDGQSHRLFMPHWWRAGRYLQLQITTAEQALTINALHFRQTGYPLDDGGEFQCDDARYQAVWPVMVRAMQMCSHEHYMDCPHYEQLMYVGDSRLEALTTYCMTTDTRLPRKAVEMFGNSRLSHGLTQSRYPCRVPQIIAPFSLWWVGMVYDHALWRGDRAFIQAMMPGVRAVLDAYALKINDADLLEPQDGWNFVDWVRSGWDRGCPPHGELRPTATITMQFVLALQHAAELEQWLDEPELADRWRRLAQRVFDAAVRTFFVAERGLLAESEDHAVFTEHAQCLALLTNLLTPARQAEIFTAWQNAKDLSPCSIYFSHYVFEMLGQMGRTDLLLERMKLWYDLPGQGFRTTVEAPEPARSDCHAWGAHPIYHAYATLLGIRPDGFGFNSVRIQPQLGTLEYAAGSLPHRSGPIRVDVRKVAGGLSGGIDLPAGLSGTLVLADRRLPLGPGHTAF